MAMSRRWRRGLIALLVVLLGVPLAYWSFAFAFLETGLGPRLLNRPSGRVQMHWQGGASWIPGKVQVEGFSLVGTSPRGSWRVEIEEAELRHGVLPLLDRTFLASSIHARGVSGGWTTFEQRRELPPLKEGEPGWRLLFPNVVIDGIEHLDLDETRIHAGAVPGAARLAMAIQVRGPFEAAHLELEMQDGRLESDGQDLGRLEQLRLAGTIEPFMPRQHRGVAFLRFTSADLELITDAWDLRSATYFFRGAPVEVDGRGRLEAQLEMRAGILQPTSLLRVSGGELDVIYDDYQATGRGGLVLAADPDAGEEHARLELGLDDFALGRTGQAPHMRGTGLSLVGTGEVLDLTDPSPQVVAELRVDRAVVPDFSVLDADLPAGSPLRLVGGTGSLGVAMRFASATGRMSGRVDLTGESVRASYQDQALTGDLRLGAQLENGDLETRRFRLKNVSLELDDVASQGVDGWWARIELPGGEAVLTRPLRLEAEASAVLRDVLPLLHLLRGGERPKRWLNRLLEEKRVQATADLRLDDDAFWVDGFDVRGGRRLTGTGRLRLSSGLTEGLALVQLGPLSMGAEFLPGGERDYRWVGSRRWYEERRAAEAARQP